MIAYMIEFFLSYFGEKLLDRVLFTPTLKKKMDAAYQKALSRWSKNEFIREQFRSKQLSTMDDFMQCFLLGNNIPDNEVKALFFEFEKALKEDSSTYSELNNLLIQQHSTIINELSETNKELSQQIKTLQFNIDRICASKLISQERDFKAQNTFAPIDNYIPRTCSLSEDNYPSDDIFKTANSVDTLISYVLGIANQSNKYVLRGDAQSGKTTELRNLAWTLAQSETFQPLFYEVKNHSDFESILQDMSLEEQQHYVIIIDALDERFDAQNRLSLFHFLNGYAVRNPNLRMVLSCRSNFKELDTLDQFTQLYLNNLSWNIITTIVKKTATHPDELIKSIAFDFWGNFSSTPFFLNAIIKKHNEDRQILQNPANIYDYMVSLCFDKEDEKNISLYGTSRAHCEEILQKVAVVLQLADRNSLTIDEIREITNSNELTEKIMRTGLLQVSAQQNHYEFIHNSYKEYFVSQYLLSCKELANIQSLCCCTGTIIIRSTWYNVLFLFVTQLNTKHQLFNDIFAWLSEDGNKEIIFHVDQDALDSDTKTQLFISYFDYFKKNDFTFPILNNGWCRNFMHFCCSSKTIDYIIGELKHSTNYNQHITNIFMCLAVFDWGRARNYFPLQTQALEIQIHKYISNYLTIDNAYWLLGVFANRFFKGSPIISDIFNLIKDLNHPNIINPFLDIVIETQQTESYLDYALQKCHFIKNFSDDRHSTHLVSKTYLLRLLKSINSHKGLAKIFSSFAKEEDYTNDRDHYFNDSLFANTLSVLLGKVIENSLAEELHQEIVNCYFNSLPQFLFMPFKSTIYKTYLQFIKEQKWIDEIFDTTIDKFCTDAHPDIDATAYYLTLALDNNYKVDEITQKIKDKYKCWLLLSLMIKNVEDRPIKEYIKTRINNDFSEFVRKQNENSFEVIQRRDLSELLNYDSFKKSFLSYLTEESPKNIVSVRDYFWNRNILPKDKRNRYIADYIPYVNEKEDFLTNMTCLIEDKNLYTHIVLRNTYNYVINTSGVEMLTSDQRDIVKELAYSNLLSAINNGDCNSLIRYNSPILDLLIAGVFPDMEEDKLLRLLPYSNYSSSIGDEHTCLFNYIEQSVGKQKLVELLPEYLHQQNYIIPQNLQIIFAPFILNNKISDEYNTLVCWSIDNFSILDMLLNDKETLNIVATRCKEFSINDRLFIFKHLAVLGDGYNWIIGELTNNWETYTNDSTNIPAVLCVLLTLNHVESLDYLLDHLELIPKMSNMITRFPEEIEGVSKLIALYSILDDGVHTPFDMQPQVLEAIHRIAIRTEEGFAEVQVEIFKLIDANPSKAFLKQHLQNWKKQMFENKSTSLNFQESYNIISKIEQLDINQ